MASITGAPNEIIDQILSFIPRSDLPNICLLNRSFKHSAEPFLYSTVTLKYEYPKFPPIVALLCTLVRRPALFDHLDIVSLKGSIAQRTPMPSMNTSTIPCDEFINAIKKTKVSFTDIWVEKLKAANTCFYALAALLITHLSKTTHLTIEDAYINGQPLIGKVLQAKVSGQLPKFERLTELRHVKRRDVSSIKNNHIFEETISLFYLPTVVDLEVSVTNPEIFRWPAGEPDLEHLTSLKIGWLCEPFLAKIFALTRNLKSLEWSWEHHGTGNFWETPVIDFHKISDTLRPLRNTLEKLRLFFWLGRDDELADNLEMTVQGNLRLRDFTRLIDLDIPLTSRSSKDWRPLALEDYAPDSVEVLTLPGTALNNDSYPGDWDIDRFEYEEIIPLLQSLADARPAKLPRLRLVEILDGGWQHARRAISGRVAELDLGFDVQFV